MNREVPRGCEAVRATDLMVGDEVVFLTTAYRVESITRTLTVTWVAFAATNGGEPYAYEHDATLYRRNPSRSI